MRIIWTRHALERAAERGISKEDAEAVLFNHHTSLPATPSGTCYIGQTPSGDTLQICIVGNMRDGTIARIKTVFIKEG
ncbi:DUF4258 domain-containing protein [Arthrobacter sp. ok362]|uniref:DUF4258 domain-containing protein n=1 Tax=Arthrobacter sp. ok362 TaxID=1761745 RepID=UPI000B882DF3